MMEKIPMLKSDKFDALKALRAEKIGVLSTASRSGEPWSSAVHFLVDQDLNFYFLTRKSTLKHKHIIENGKASLNVGLFGGGKRGNFQIAGGAKPLSGASDWRMLMLTLFSQRQLNDLHMDAIKDDPFFELKEHDFVMLVLKPKFIRWMKLVKGKPTYETVLP